MKVSGLTKTSLADWMEEGKKHFGENFDDWKFECPACGHIQSIKDFVDVGADRNDSYQECIGRKIGKGSPQKGDSTGCNWAAYGFFGTCGKGRIVVTEDGKEIEVFQFALSNIKDKEREE